MINAKSWAVSSVAERCLHTAEVTGSNPVRPTNSSFQKPASRTRLYVDARQQFRHPYFLSNSAERHEPSTCAKAWMASLGPVSGAAPVRAQSANSSTSSRIMSAMSGTGASVQPASARHLNRQRRFLIRPVRQGDVFANHLERDDRLCAVQLEREHARRHETRHQGRDGTAFVLRDRHRHVVYLRWRGQLFMHPRDAHGIAQQVVQRVAVVNPHLHERAARALVPEITPPVGREELPHVVREHRLRPERPADGSIFNQRAYFPVARRTAVAMPHRQRLAGRLPGFQHFGRFGQYVRHRLLHPDVLARLERGDDLGRMHFIGVVSRTPSTSGFSSTAS